MISPPKIYPDIYPFIAPSTVKNAHSGRVVLITGAGGTIASQIALHFAIAGATVAITDISAANLSRTVDAVEKEGGKAYAFPCDISDQEAVNSMIDEVVREVGDIDVLVNAAGICSSKPIFFETFDHIWREIQINLGGVLLTMMNVLPRMKQRGHGVIINVASRAGTVSIPYCAGYNVSKCAVIKATESVQKDLDADGLGDRIQVYCCHPGGVKSDMSTKTMDPDVAAAYPSFAALQPKWIEAFKTSPSLCAAVCVFLATGKVKDSLKGRYIDCEHDISAFTTPESAKEIQEKDLHVLKVEFLGGVPNDGGSSSAAFNDL